MRLHSNVPSSPAMYGIRPELQLPRQSAPAKDIPEVVPERVIVRFEATLARARCNAAV